MDVERTVGYVSWAVSTHWPQKGSTPSSAPRPRPDYLCQRGVSAGRLGLQIELNPEDLMKLAGGCFAEIGQ